MLRVVRVGRGGLIGNSHRPTQLSKKKRLEREVYIAYISKDSIAFDKATRRGDYTIQCPIPKYGEKLQGLNDAYIACMIIVS